MDTPPAANIRQARMGMRMGYSNSPKNTGVMQASAPRLKIPAKMLPPMMSPVPPPSFLARLRLFSTGFRTFQPSGWALDCCCL